MSKVARAFTIITDDPVGVGRHAVALPNATETELIQHNLAVQPLRLRPCRSEKQLGTASSMSNRAGLGLWEASSTASTRSLVVADLAERSSRDFVVPDLISFFIGSAS